MHLQHCLVVTWLMPPKTAAVSAHVLCTPYTMSRHFTQSHMSFACRVHACLAVICRLHFWQNGRDLSVRATTVTRGMEQHNNKYTREIRLGTEIDPGKDHSPAIPARRYSNPRPFAHESGSLGNHCVTPFPNLRRVEMSNW